MQCDYITATTTDVARGGYWLDAVGVSERVVQRRLLGYDGWYDPERQAFVGSNHQGRWLMTVAGEPAHLALHLIGEPDETVSLARLDAQVTVLVADADEFIRECQGRSRYRQLLIDPAPNRGLTRYVGAPASQARVRVYNKSVQSGIETPLGELLRVELQARDDLAERLYLAYHLNGAGGLRGAAIAQIERMLILPEPVWLREPVVLPSEPPRAPRYETWLMETVLPALRKVAVSEPQLFETFLRQLDVLQSAQP